MSETGARPGGLTALAVINFIFAVWGFIVALGALTAPFFFPALVVQAEQNVKRLEAGEAAAATRAVESRDDSGPSGDTLAKDLAKARKDLESLKKGEKEIAAHKTEMMAVGVARAILAALLIVSGIGYLKVRKVLGRVMGNVYALADIALGCLGLYLASQEAEHQQFGIFNLIAFIYPLITLFALNVVFKDDFVG